MAEKLESASRPDGCGGKQAPSATSASAPTHQFQPKRGRPTADQAAAIAQSILHAASELFLAKGFEATAMEAVADAARVPRSTLYKRYPTKLALLQAVARDRVARWERIGVKNYAPLTDDLETRLKQHAEHVLHGAISDDVRAFMRLTAGPWEGAAEVRQVLNEVGYGAMVGFLEREIFTFGKDEISPPKDARLVAEALMGMLTGWLAAREVDGAVSREDARSFAHAAVDLLLHGRAAW